MGDITAIRNNTPYLLVKGHVWYSITEDFRSRLRTLLISLILAKILYVSTTVIF